ncbi:uncharacterized protein L969DRAFT_91603 [Mixia osmundae IAM 14324]|uniref:Uncharacterized protein n=1 Tax=Mixia osmundae (strain CBS 9802 / IAM 14324 / JCM 22182 / KY 12970) TaxID=764103 RepID=G7DZY8_MIXOS|nr:uncharacterized protein L969DRAFT_91603 [Mixia osmundae IAM 14324]KEI42140.1 hypothetical protein L969DRAFT_91603 [Mixia osmundae IAM 14324]GAA96148.1 hypothetical protein E5Q_02809 [Mixia osmundae IAM 14324]
MSQTMQLSQVAKGKRKALRSDPKDVIIIIIIIITPDDETPSDSRLERANKANELAIVDGRTNAIEVPDGDEQTGEMLPINSLEAALQQLLEFVPDDEIVNTVLGDLLNAATYPKRECEQVRKQIINYILE